MINPFYIREKISRGLAWCVAICLLNSIIELPQMDTPVASVNEIETVYEWVLEEVADIEDAVPEQDEEDHQQSFLKDKQYWFVQERLLLELPLAANQPVKGGIYKRSAIAPFTGRQFPPPRMNC